MACPSMAIAHSPVTGRFAVQGTTHAPGKTGGFGCLIKRKRNHRGGPTVPDLLLHSRTYSCCHQQNPPLPSGPPPGVERGDERGTVFLRTHGGGGRGRVSPNARSRLVGGFTDPTATECWTVFPFATPLRESMVCLLQESLHQHSAAHYRVAWDRLTRVQRLLARKPAPLQSSTSVLLCWCTESHLRRPIE